MHPNLSEVYAHSADTTYVRVRNLLMFSLPRIFVDFDSRVALQLVYENQNNHTRRAFISFFFALYFLLIPCYVNYFGRPQPSTSTSSFRPAASSLLQDIENSQASLFKFTTRHMYVNPDHSMSPIAVTKKPSLPSKTKSSGSFSSQLNFEPKTSPPVPSTSKTLLPVPVNNQPTKTAVAGNSTSYLNGEKVNGWSTEGLAHAKMVLQETLKFHLLSGRINKKIHDRIIDRALTKVLLFSKTEPRIFCA